MKNKYIIQFAFINVLLFAGCASHPAPKPIHERGWIGGRYERAKNGRSTTDWLFGNYRTIFDFPPALTNARTAAVLTLALGTNTPAYMAGLREGDLILELGHQSVTNLPGFYKIINDSRPGTELPVELFRHGHTAQYTITVGREKFRDGGMFNVMLPGYVAAPHPIATKDAPWFSLVALGYEQNTDAPFEFASVKEQYRESCHPKGKHEGYDEDWRCWLAIMELKKGKRIVAQEVVKSP